MSFTDSKGRVFEARLVLPTVITLKKLGVDLGEELPTLVAKVQADPELLANVLWIIHADSAKALGVSDLEFGGLLDGDVLPRAFDSMMEAIVSFSPPATRTALRKLVQTGREVELLAAQKLEAAANALTPAMVLSTLSASAGNSPASPDSNQTTELSANSTGQPEQNSETNTTDGVNS